MMTNWHMGRALAALFFVIWTGCAQNERGGHSIYGGKGTADVATSRPPVAQGTVDSGGGAGFKGRPLEGHRKDITTFPEFKKWVEPILRSIGRMHPSHQSLFVYIVKERTWLFLDAPVPKISNDRQSTPYTIDQWAVQNSKEIQMSNEYKGSEEDRAKILLHEIFVGLKIMRYGSYNEYCFAFAPDRKLCAGSRETPIDKNYKLNDVDHEDVRAMTSWLWQNHDKMTHPEFAHEMHRHQFQSIHYSWKQYLFPTSSTPKQVNEFFEQWAKTPSRLFADYGMEHLAESACEISFSFPSHKSMSAKVRIVDIKTRREKAVHDFLLVYESAKPLMASNIGRRERAFGVQFLEDKVIRAPGGRRKALNLSFEGESLYEAYGGFQDIKIAPDGTQSSTMSLGGDRDNFICQNNYIHLPYNYLDWIDLRAADRVKVERWHFSGKTLEEMIVHFKRNLPPYLADNPPAW